MKEITHGAGYEEKPAHIQDVESWMGERTCAFRLECAPMSPYTLRSNNLDELTEEELALGLRQPREVLVHATMLLCPVSELLPKPMMEQPRSTLV